MFAAKDDRARLQKNVYVVLIVNFEKVFGLRTWYLFVKRVFHFF